VKKRHVGRKPLGKVAVMTGRFDIQTIVRDGDVETSGDCHARRGVGRADIFWRSALCDPQFLNDGNLARFRNLRDRKSHNGWGMSEEVSDVSDMLKVVTRVGG
jgi:hypothetical protein